MSEFNPAVGDYCLLQRESTAMSARPVLVCPDDMAPPHVSASRPSTFNHLVMLVQPKPVFLYALSSELRTFEPQNIDGIRHCPGLAEAYELVYRAWDYGDPIDYWRRTTEDQRVKSALVKREWTPASEDDSDSDPEIREAIRRSRADMRTKSQSALLTPSPSPEKSYKSQRVTPPSPCPSAPSSILRYFLPATAISGGENPPRSHKPAQPEDIVEGDLSDSKEFVEFLIGPDKVRYLIPRHEIKKREYYEVIYRKYEQLKGDKTWAVVMPCLATMDPIDFEFAAEFLSTGDFGIRIIDDSNRDEAMAQCIAAWDVGEKLGMQDLLDRIVIKSQAAQPWNTEEVTIFSSVVYRAESFGFEAHDVMKNMLAKFMADNFYDMLEAFGRAFTDEMRKIPELERDVYARLRDIAEKRLEAEFEGEVD